MVQNPTPGAAASTTMATTRPTVVHPIFTAFQHWARTRTIAALRRNTAAQHSATQQVQLCKAELASVQSQNPRGRAMAENAACRTLRTEMAAWSDKVTTCEQTGQRLTLQLFRRALRTSPGVPAQADPAGLRLFGELNWDNICAANPGIAAPAAVKVLRVMWQAFPAANRHKYQIKAWTPAGKQQLQWTGLPGDYSGWAASVQPSPSLRKNATIEPYMVPAGARAGQTKSVPGAHVVPGKAASTNATAGPHGHAGAGAAQEESKNVSPARGYPTMGARVATRRA